jgi:amino acid transporter
VPNQAPDDDPTRTLSLLGAVGVGVGSIVGGGILILAGSAFAAAGPSAILAFAFNGVIAFLTAMSFAEMSAAFPESGGAYTFAKKLLTVRAAFAVGWVLWFAYIVAGALYALGFAEYFVVAIVELFRLVGATPPAWLSTRAVLVGLALLASATYTLLHIRKSGGGGQWENVGKVVLFVGLVLVGAWALAGSPDGTIGRRMTPFFAHGGTGLLVAMGFTFITVQGFDLIAAVGGEVRSPTRNIPRAMFIAIGIGLVVYIPLLFVIATVGIPEEQSLSEASVANPSTFSAAAIREFSGTGGYAVIVVATILATLSALSSNVLAASRVASSMARDRTLPRVIAEEHPTRGTPIMALYASALALVCILLMVPDAGSAGAAASLIFLVSFGLVHWMAFLSRRRSVDSPWKSPLYPLVPVVGGIACMALALFQAIAVPAAGAIALVWLGLGVLLYFSLFAGRAQVVDAFSEALDPKLAMMRGKSPLVLAPVANPLSAAGIVALANALAPPVVGRVVVLSVLRKTDASKDLAKALRDAQAVVRETLSISIEGGHAPEALLTIADDPWEEIADYVRTRRCESLLLGVGLAEAGAGPLEALMNEVDCDVVLLKAPTGWSLSSVKRVVVPVGGRGKHDELRARLLGALGRSNRVAVRFVRIVPTDVSTPRREAMHKELLAFAEEETRGTPEAEVITSDAAIDAIARAGTAGDLMIVGLRRHKGRRLLGAVAIEIARKTDAAVLMISRG